MWQEWINALVAPLLPAIGVFLAALVAFVLRKFYLYLVTKFGWQRDEAAEQFLDQKAFEAVTYAEHQARQALKAGEPAHDGPRKLKAATEFLAAEVERRKLPTIAAQGVERLIEAKLSTLSEPVADAVRKTGAQ